ncbi:MAG: (d)CMP kinase, partial [Planctomycetota bacterium]
MSNQSPLIIAVDGPAGAGKSTVVKQLARGLGLLYLDTGAMYRAATVGLLASTIDPNDAPAIAAWCSQRAIDFDNHGQVRLDGAVVDPAVLRSPATTREIWRIADNPSCRAHLVALQQAIVRGRDAALEGRDATTVICPDATLKVYLDASPEERARRRLAEWQAGGQPAPEFDTLVAELRERDRRDMERESGALTRSDEAVFILTDGLSVEEVVAQIMALAIQRRPLGLEALVADQVIVGRSRAPGYVRVAQGSIAIPPAPWQLGLTNPSPDRLPGATVDLARNHGGRQAGVLCQGQAVLVLAGRGEDPSYLLAMPLLPQSWYVIEPGTWHAVFQVPGTI